MGKSDFAREKIMFKNFAIELLFKLKYDIYMMILNKYLFKNGYVIDFTLEHAKVRCIVICLQLFMKILRKMFISFQSYFDL